MQTFLPLPDFAASAAALDRQRLGKQRVECLQLLGVLADPSRGWGSHPAARMWRGHAGSLCSYALAVCDEWTSRGYRDTCRAKSLLLAEPDRDDPPWLGDPWLHLTHRSNLVRKDPARYGALWPGTPPDLPYAWPA